MNKAHKHLLLAGGLLLGLTGAASAIEEINVVNADWTVNTAIPVGNPVGITTAQTFTGIPQHGPLGIGEVSVDLDISGGYNGALYASLTFQDAKGDVATEVLLNELGVTPSYWFGSAGAGLNVTLSDTGTANGSIHAAAGIPTGTWLPDSANTLDATFGGLPTANGTWTLFVADLDAGTPTPTLVSWGLNVDEVPDQPLTPAFTAVLLGLVTVGGSLWRTTRRQTV
jgi:hypothetical protein